MRQRIKSLLIAMYPIPVVGYALRKLVTIALLPRRAAHLLQRDDAAWQQHIPAFLNAASSVGAFGHQLALQGEKVSTLEQRHEALEAAWHQHVPSLLNAASSVGAFGHQLARHGEAIADLQRRTDCLGTGASRSTDDFTALNEAILKLNEAVENHWRKFGDIERRIEFVRREIMFEMRYGAFSRTTPLPTGPLVANHQALTRGDHRLNLGSGHVPLDEYINIDARQLPGVDIVATVDNLPFNSGTIGEIRLDHVLEHFPQEELRLKLLPYWIGLLKVSGLFRAVVPDAEAMINAAASGAYKFEDFREVFFGAQEYAGDFHFNMFTPASLKELLTEAGFHSVDVVATGRPNGRCYEFEIHAIKPPPSPDIAAV